MAHLRQYDQSRLEEKTAILLDILKRNKVPTLINRASGSLVGPEKYKRKRYRTIVAPVKTESVSQ